MFVSSFSVLRPNDFVGTTLAILDELPLTRCIDRVLSARSAENGLRGALGHSNGQRL